MGLPKQGKGPGLGLYFAAIILLLAAYFVFYGTARTPAVSYAKVEALFETEQVESFQVRDGDELYLYLKDGSAVRNDLESTYAFRQDFGEIIQDQKARGVLRDYDYAPVYTPPWWSGWSGRPVWSGGA